MTLHAHAPAGAERLRGECLTAGYDERPVVHEVDFRVPDGQVTMLLGPNGSGKSTLLKTLARTLAPAQGRVLLDGTAIHRSSTREIARKLGVLPQGPSAPEGVTVRELVALGRFPHQHLWRQWTREDERAVNDAMATANVAAFADRPIDDLSGGQRQRCWIAMILAQETDLILLDEPTTFLDLKVQVDLLELLVRLAHDNGRTLLVVLHDLNLAAAYADVLVMMRNGRIVHSGTPETVFTAGNLRTVFDLEANVIRDPHSGRLLCVPALSSPAASRRIETACAPA
ncbi:ABC transporter ATP-binding protein [Arhodomonas sp. AD133]|uniref:ABC transporter ATP-binding protein n=1 Tax=Arhodomonas sp. AD133 TaxID=3415009 RepID=UPI003EBA1987